MGNGGRGVRVSLKGVHTVKRKLADGSVRTHYYAWRGGPKLGVDLPSDGLVTAYAKAMEKAQSAGKQPVHRTD